MLLQCALFRVVQRREDDVVQDNAVRGVVGQDEAVCA